MQDFETDGEFSVCLAHHRSWIPVGYYFPKETLNDWNVKELKERNMWCCLNELLKEKMGKPSIAGDNIP